jgi:hypothetical protein
VAHPLDTRGNLDAEPLEHGRHQVDVAEQASFGAVRPWPAGGQPHHQGDGDARVVQGGLRAREGDAVVGGEDHPGLVGQPGTVDGVEQPPDRRIGAADGALEAGEVVAGPVVVGKERRHLHPGRVVGRVGPVHLVEADGEQERAASFGRALRLQDGDGRVGDRAAVGRGAERTAGRDDLVEADRVRVEALVLEAGEHGVVAGGAQQHRQGLLARRILPAEVGEAHQAVGVRVATGEQRPAGR